MPTPRLRVFAGPNGSGKSTIKEQVPPNLINTYVNADEIEKSAKADGFVDLTQFNVQATGDELRTFFASHALIQKEHLQDQASLFDMNGLRIDVRRLDFNSYHASVIADFIRQKLLENRVSFTFETVMSSGDKVAFMRRAQELGYRTYLYFVATDNPNININRVANRVDDGGHNVPTRSFSATIGHLSYCRKQSQHPTGPTSLITRGKALSGLLRSQTVQVLSTSPRSSLIGLWRPT